MSAGSLQPPSLADQAARDLAVSEFVRPVVLEAGAGTGKTRALVARLATWLLGPGWTAAAAELEEASRIFTGSRPAPAAGSEIAARVAEGTVAITFTDAAAAEMSRRLGALLGELASGRPASDLAPLPALLEGVELGARADRLAVVLSRLRLQTIHGFCHRLLADHPFEAGLHPTLTVDADGSALDAAATEVLLDRLRTRQPQIAALVACGVDPADLHASLVKLVGGGARKEDFADERFDGATCAAILARIAQPLDLFLPELARLAAKARKNSTLHPALVALQDLARSLLEGGRDRAGLEALGEQARATRRGWEELLKRYAKGKLNKTEEKELGSGRGAFLAGANAAGERLAGLLALDPRKFELARQALGPLVEEVRVRLQRTGVLSFEDLLDRATDLLRKSSTVRRRLRREIRQLLVDEFQDTDRRQCDLLAALALDDDAESRPGLFVVGDPKQSIYAWRSADLASYERFLARMQEAGGLRAQLSVNFRSVPAVLAEVERVVAPAMRPEPGVQPRFERLTAGPARAASAGFKRRDRHPVEYWVSWDTAARAQGEPTRSAQATALEAAAIATDIRELHDSDQVAWGSFGILLKARTDLEVYLEALRRAGVPYAVQKDRSYYRRREIIDLACAVRTILDPADLLALVAFLRSPLVGVPDAAWIPLWRAGFAAAMANLEAADESSFAAVEGTIATAVGATPREIPGLSTLPDWPAALGAAVRAIALLRDEFRRLPAESWVERLRARLLPEPLAAARFLGRFGIANVERLLARLEVDLAEESDPHRALARLRRAVDEERAAEDARPPDTGGDAVAVMTIHTAKGLEFEQVYVTQMHKERPSAGAGKEGPETDLVDPAPATGIAARRELLLFDAPSPGYFDADFLRRRSRDAEAVRLLYVALTRAKDRLVICGNWPSSPQTLDLAAAKSFLDLLAERPPTRLHELVGGQEIFDAAGVPWRLAVSRSPAEDRSPAAVQGALPLARAAVAPAAVTAGQRHDARRRGERLRLDRAAALAGSEEWVDDGEALSAPGGVVPRSLALALGVALHRALELEALADGAPEEWQRAAESAFAAKLPEASGEDRQTLLTELARLRMSPLLAALRALRFSVLARELPLLAASGGSGPIDGVVGKLDLLYLDAATGQHVVADFKTDGVEDGSAALAAKVERYRPQLELYGRAVQSALALERPPRLELWLLAVDRIEVLR